MESQNEQKIPVTLVTGFLGAGKTTLLNHLLTQWQSERLAVIVNEFGDVGIDDKLLLRTDEEIFEMNSGAMCCAMRGDTTKVLLKLVEQKGGAFDRVVIETTGLANPVPVARLFFEKPALKERYRLDAIVTLVDASQILQQLQETPEAKMQIAAADIVLLNKVDLADERTRGIARMQIRKINPLASIRETSHSNLSLEDLKQVGADQTYVRELSDGDEHGHNEDVHSFVLRAEKPLDLSKVARWVGEMLVLNGDKLMRYKGLLDIAGMDERFVFQGVYRHFENTKDRPWQEGEERVSQVVVIGRDLDPQVFRDSFAELVAD